MLGESSTIVTTSLPCATRLMTRIGEITYEDGVGLARYCYKGKDLQKHEPTAPVGHWTRIWAIGGSRAGKLGR